MTKLIRSFVTIAAVVFFATPALAGPPLICHPIDIGSAKSILEGRLYDSASGVVSVADATKINYETAPGHAYSITVQASDGAGHT